MKKRNFQKALLIAGLLVLSGSFVITRYLTISDPVNGFIKGFAIGLLLLAVVISFKKLHTKEA